MSSHIDSLLPDHEAEESFTKSEHYTAVYKHYNMFPESLYGNNEEIRGRLTELGRIRERSEDITSGTLQTNHVSIWK